MPTWRTSRTSDNRWYLGVPCTHCKTPILFGLDPSEGEGPIRTSIRLLLTCPDADCRQQADYSGQPVGRYHKNAERPASASHKAG